MATVITKYGPCDIKNIIGSQKLRLIAYQTVPYDSRFNVDLVFKDTKKANDWIDQFLIVPNRKVKIYRPKYVYGRFKNRWEKMGELTS